MTHLLAEKQDGVAVLTLNRPASRNAISPEMACRLADALADAADDDAVRVVVLTGADVRSAARRGDAERLSAVPRGGRVRVWPVVHRGRRHAVGAGAAGYAQPAVRGHDLAAGGTSRHHRAVCRADGAERAPGATGSDPAGRPIRVAYTGGSVLPTELADAFEARTGIPVRNILGITECAGVLTIGPFHAPRTPGSTGLRMPFCQVRCEAAEGGPPIVVTSGPNVSPGYGGGGASSTFRADGWLVSGDIGHQDSVGRLFITGRAKDVIIRDSHNIDPAAIEEAALQHPAVSVAAAVGLPDRYAGELPAVFVTLKPGHAVTEAELAAFMAARVPEPAARPKRVWIIDAMPLTPVGKIFKPALRAQAACHAVALHLAALDPAPDVVGVTGGGPDGTTVQIAGLNAAEEARLRAALAGLGAIRFNPAS